MGGSPLARRVEDAVTDAVAALGLLVEDVTVTPAGSRRVVRIAVDRDLGEVAPVGTSDAVGTESAGSESAGAGAESGSARVPVQEPVPPLDLDAVAEATTVISEALDASDALGAAPYTLEVTSPGVGRPLTLPRHFRRNVGRLVRLTTVGSGEKVTGRLLAAGPDVVWLRVQGEKAKGAAARSTETLRCLPFAQIDRGDVQVEFGRVEDAAPVDDDEPGVGGDRIEDQED